MTASTQRRVLITGAGRGLGLALAARLVDRGHRVFGAARSTDPEALREIGPEGIVRIDVTDGDSIAAAMEELAATVGGIDVLINNAGIDSRALSDTGADRGALDVDADVLAGVLAVNTVGPMAVTKAALPLLAEGTGAMVINVSSQLGSMEVGGSIGPDAAYNTSKAALNMWTIKAAEALRADGIGMVVVHPGWVSTDMGGPSAALSPSESAAALADLAEQLTIDDSGRFLRWDGVDHPW